MDEETTTMAPQAEKPAPSRRKFLTGAAATAAGATAVLAAPNVSRAQTVDDQDAGRLGRQRHLQRHGDAVRRPRQRDGAAAGSRSTI